LTLSAVAGMCRRDWRSTATISAVATAALPDGVGAAATAAWGRCAVAARAAGEASGVERDGAATGAAGAEGATVDGGPACGVTADGATMEGVTVGGGPAAGPVLAGTVAEPREAGAAAPHAVVDPTRSCLGGAPTLAPDGEVISHEPMASEATAMTVTPTVARRPTPVPPCNSPWGRC